MTAVLAGLALGLAAPSVAAACSLPSPAPGPPPLPGALLEDYDVAVYGVVASVRYLETAPGDLSPGQRRYEARVRVTRVFKGAVGKTVRVSGDTDEGLCGFGVVKPRQRLALRLSQPSRPYGLGLSSRVSLQALLKATGGGWHRPPG